MWIHNWSLYKVYILKKIHENQHKYLKCTNTMDVLLGFNVSNVLLFHGQVLLDLIYVWEL